jgi:hypothetical protein
MKDARGKQVRARGAGPGERRVFVDQSRHVKRDEIYNGYACLAALAELTEIDQWYPMTCGSVGETTNGTLATVEFGSVRPRSLKPWPVGSDDVSGLRRQPVSSVYGLGFPVSDVRPVHRFQLLLRGPAC